MARDDRLNIIAHICAVAAAAPGKPMPQAAYEGAGVLLLPANVEQMAGIAQHLSLFTDVKLIVRKGPEIRIRHSKVRSSFRDLKHVIHGDGCEIIHFFVCKQFFKFHNIKACKKLLW